MAMESCAVKTTLAGGAGFGIGAFFFSHVSFIRI